MDLTHVNGNRSPQQVLDDELLVIRAKVLEVAAALDRIERAAGPPANAETLATLRAAIDTLSRPGANRAEQVQLLFSRAYDDRWREKFEV